MIQFRLNLNTDPKRIADDINKKFGITAELKDRVIIVKKANSVINNKFNKPRIVMWYDDYAEEIYEIPLTLIDEIYSL